MARNQGHLGVVIFVQLEGVIVGQGKAQGVAFCRKKPV